MVGKPLHALGPGVFMKGLRHLSCKEGAGTAQPGVEKALRPDPWVQTPHGRE